MNQKSSRKQISDVSDKFYDGKRRIFFPKELFIELKLSKAQIAKVRGWQNSGHTVIPMWFHTCERVLFIDEELFDEWTQRKKKP